MIGAPTNTASAKRQLIKTIRMMLSLATRLVDAISNAMPAVKFAPLRNNERARATAAHEQDDEAAPSATAVETERGRRRAAAGHFAMRDHGLNDSGERKSEDKGPKDLPPHCESLVQGVDRRIDH